LFEYLSGLVLPPITSVFFAMQRIFLNVIQLSKLILNAKREGLVIILCWICLTQASTSIFGYVCPQQTRRQVNMAVLLNFTCHIDRKQLCFSNGRFFDELRRNLKM
jgi:hypothetical protein